MSEDGGQNIIISDAFIKGKSCVFHFKWTQTTYVLLLSLPASLSWLDVHTESLFNRRVEEKAKEMLFTPLGWHHSSLDQLREENGEKKAMERLL